jgi:prevent-host-death family protein
MGERRVQRMTRRVSTAEAKARLSELIGAVAYGRERVMIERRGRPIAALVSVEDAQVLEETRPITDAPRGALALVGAWSDIDDHLVEDLVDEMYEARRRDLGRPVDLDA